MAKPSKNLRLRETTARLASLRGGLRDASHDSRVGDLVDGSAPIGMDRGLRATDGRSSRKRTRSLSRLRAAANPGAGSREGDRRIAARKDEGETFPYCNPLKSPEMRLESRNRRWTPGNAAKSRNLQMLSGGSPRPGDARGASCGKRDPRRERKSRRGFGRLKFKCRDDLPLPSSCESLTRVCGAAAQRIHSRPSALAGASGAIP
jgi:hypothetical protein